MENKKKSESEQKLKSPFISKRSKKLAERHALKASQVFTQSFHVSSKESAKKSQGSNRKSSQPRKTFDIEYLKEHDFLLDLLKKK